MDKFDATILKALATNARHPVSAIAETVGLSQSACTRRIQNLEQQGYIHGYSARLARRKMGFKITALVDITLGTQVEEDLEAFEVEVASIAGIVECALVSGGQDYRLKILCRDLDDYERLHRERLGRLPGVVTINSSFVLRNVPTRGEADALFGE